MTRERWTRGRLVSLLACMVLHASASAQPAPAPSAPPAQPQPAPPWADFPTVPSDAPYIEARWPKRHAPPDAGVGVVVEVAPPRWPSNAGAAPGLTLVYDEADAHAVLGPGDIRGRFRTEGPGSFRFAPALDESQGKRRRSTLLLRYVSAREGAPTVLERTWFAFDEPLPDASGRVPATRGVVLLMPGLFSTPEGILQSLSRALRTDGWCVLRMLAQPSRFTEKLRITVDADADIESTAADVAREFDERGAECAYAARGAFEKLESLRPELKQLPRMAIGFSAGAMTLPTVVSLEPGRYAGSVIVGGGCDFLLMNERSNYRSLIDAVQVHWASPPTPERRGQLFDAYLRHATLDSYHTAGAMRGRPALCIQGTIDFAVPSPLGDLLWERLGKPDRRLEEAGHELLFMQLPARYPDILTWLDHAAPRAEQPLPAEPK